MDRGNRRISTNKRIVNSKLFSRTVAAIVDFAMVAFVGGILMMGLQPLFGLSDLVNVPKATFSSYLEESNLYAKNKDGQLVAHEYDTYEEYQTLIFDYYSDYKVNEAPEEFRVNYAESYNGSSVEYWYNVNILGLPDDLGLFTREQKGNIPDFITLIGPDIFEYVKDSTTNEINYNVLAVKKDDVDAKEAKNFYYIPDAENKEGKPGVYVYAVFDLTNTPYYVSAFEAWNLWFYYVPLFLSFVISGVVFLFVIPMCLKYGRTIGKLLFHLAVVNNLGYDIKRSQIIIRFWLPVLILIFGFIVCQFIPKPLLAFLGYCTILTLVSYCLVIFTKDRKSIHDYIALTQVIDANESVWYKDASEEDAVLSRVSEADSHLEDADFEEELKGKDVLYINHNYGKQEEKNEDKKDTSEK